jgi:Family of unknown function (DUF6788)
MTAYRAGMSARERNARSKLAKIVHELGIIRGTLRQIERYCGRVDCKCIKGQKHPMIYIAQIKNGKVKSIYVSQDKKELSNKWIKNYKEAKELLEIISEECIARLKKKHL